MIRPPIASGRLRFADAETLVFSLKTHWADGTCQLLLSPQELLEKLAALVPPPRLNLVRYHGVLAPGRMKVMAALTAPSAILAFLNAVGLPSRAPPIAPPHLDSPARIR